MVAMKTTNQLQTLQRRIANVFRTSWSEAGRVVDQLVVRPIQRSRKAGLYARPLDFDRDRVVLLFFENIYSDRFARGDRHLRLLAHDLWRAARNRRRSTGIGVAFEALCQSLRLAGYNVVLNDRGLALANPNYPVGITGYRHIIDGWDLPNPAVLGPGMYDHPGENSTLMDDKRFRSYLVPGPWMKDLFAKKYAHVAVWFAGIDTDEWSDQSTQPKDLDFIVYDKPLWEKEQTRALLVTPIEEELNRRGLSFVNMKYGEYTTDSYRALLRRSRGMIFICEHETQGQAYQEALASNVPVLAWDQGFWLDPKRLTYGDETVPASSVPYFADGITGERFDQIGSFPLSLDRFIRARTNYRPRQFVLDNLSFAKSAETYLTHYRAALTK